LTTFGVAWLALWLLLATPAEASLFGGIAKVVTGVLTLPLSILAGTMNGPPIIGTLAGAVNGTISGVGLVLSGAVDLAAAAIPVAKAVAPFLAFL
jgi:hypothetical protein